MTIGIGVLAGEDYKPDSLVMIADSMGSFGDTHSSSELHKLHAIEGEDLYAVSSGSIDRASEQMNILVNVLRTDYPTRPRKYPQIVQALLKTVSLYKDMRFEVDCLPQFRMAREEWFKVQDPHFRDLLLQAYSAFHVGCETLIGTFGANGQAYLFCLLGDGTFENVTFPGFAAIGSGANNAMFWLSYRKHKLSCSVRRAAYHAYEAKRMAENSPHVNDRIDLVVARKGKHYLLHNERHSVDGCSVSLPELSKLFKKFNVRDTGRLDPPEQKQKPAFVS